MKRYSLPKCEKITEALQSPFYRFILHNVYFPPLNCRDNTPSESFFSTLKTELCGHRAFGG